MAALTEITIAGTLEDASGNPIANKTCTLVITRVYGAGDVTVPTKNIRFRTDADGDYSLVVQVSDAADSYVAASFRIPGQGESVDTIPVHIPNTDATTSIQALKELYDAVEQQSAVTLLTEALATLEELAGRITVIEAILND